MAELMLINPKKKRRSTKRRTTKRTNPITAMNPVKRKRRSKRRSTSFARSVGKIKRRMSRARRGKSKGNFLTTKGFMNEILLPSAVGASGALVLDMVASKLPLPSMLTQGALKPVTRLALAAGMGWAASSIVNKKVGEQVAAGAVVVILYDTLKMYLKQIAPNLPLSESLEYANAGYPVGEYVMYDDSSSSNIVQPMNVNEYVTY